MSDFGFQISDFAFWILHFQRALWTSILLHIFHCQRTWNEAPAIGGLIVKTGNFSCQPMLLSLPLYSETKWTSNICHCQLSSHSKALNSTFWSQFYSVSFHNWHHLELNPEPLQWRQIFTRLIWCKLVFFVHPNSKAMGGRALLNWGDGTSTTISQNRQQRGGL